MGHDKLRKFAENETFGCLLQPSAEELLSDGYARLRDHSVKGTWPAPVVLELGCGKGEYTIALAKRNPGRHYVGVDIKGARLWKGAKYVTENGLHNVNFLRTKVEFITAFFAPGEVSEIWLTFSDPQFRSENSRLCAPVFLGKYRSLMRQGGLVHLKTDSQFLYEYARAVCKVNGLEIVADTADLYRSGAEDGGPAVAGVIAPEVREVQTFYETLFRAQGYPIRYLSFRIDHEGEYIRPRDPEDFDSAAWRAVEGPRILFGHDSAETRRRKLASGEV